MSACARAASRTSSGVAVAASIDRRRAVSRAVLSEKPLTNRPSSASSVGSADGMGVTRSASRVTSASEGLAVSGGAVTSWAEACETATVNSRQNPVTKADRCRATWGRSIVAPRQVLTTLPDPPITLVFHPVRASSVQSPARISGVRGVMTRRGPDPAGSHPGCVADAKAGRRSSRRPAPRKGSGQIGAATTCSTAASGPCSGRSSACPQSWCSRR